MLIMFVVLAPVPLARAMLFITMQGHPLTIQLLATQLVAQCTTKGTKATAWTCACGVHNMRSQEL